MWTLKIAPVTIADCGVVLFRVLVPWSELPAVSVQFTYLSRGLFFRPGRSAEREFLLSLVSN